jgi:hypothetical protein
MTPLQSAARLVAIAEDGCALAAAGGLEELAGQQAAWDAAVAELGPLHALSADAVALVRRAAELQGEQTAILAAAQSEVEAELSRLRTARQGARGYVGAGGLPAHGSALNATA